MNEIRQERIRELIEQKGNVTIEELAERFSVSDMTIYRDLKVLQNEGVLEQIRGGAILSKKRATGFSYEFRRERRLFSPQKKAIAKKAMSFLKPGMSIAFDNSSTAFEMVKKLKDFRGLTVFATSQAALNELSTNMDIDVYCCGGLYSNKTDAFIGSVAEKFFDGISANICFVGASGLTLENGLTDPLPSEATLKRKIMKYSKTTVVLADSSKIGNVVMEKVVEVDEIDYLITDWEVDREKLKDLQKKIKVIVCDPE